MGISYFVDVPQPLVSLLRTHPSLPRHTAVDELAEPEALFPAIRRGDQPVDLVALGPRLSDPLRVAQQIHQVDKQIPLLLLCEPEQYLSLKHALQFTPLLGRDVRCCSLQDHATTVAAIQDAVLRTTQRRLYNAQIHAANQQLTDITSARPSATEYLGRLLDHAPIGIATLDQHGAVVGWNRTAGTLIQRSERDVLGIPFVALFPPTEQAALQHILHESAATDRAIMPTLVQAARADGLSLWLQITAAPLPLPGYVRGTLLLFEDVTARIHAEQEREASQQRLTFLAELGLVLAASLDYQTTLSRLAEALVPTLADWCIIDLIEADQRLDRVAVATANSAIEQPLHMLRERYPLTWESRQPAAEALRQRRGVLFPGFSPESLAATVYDQDHLTLIEVLKPQSAMAVPIMLRDRLLGALTLARIAATPAYTEQDLRFAEEVANRAALVIENTRLYAEAQAAIQTRDQFLSLAAHELRTPITTVLGSAQLIQRQLKQSPAATDRELQRVQTLIDHVWRLQRLIQTLLDPARIAAGQLSIEREPVDLSLTIRQILEALQPTLRDHHIVTQGLDTPCIITGDQMRLEQVVQNILQNAIKYSPNGGAIRVELAQHTQHVDLTIHDEGIGIPSDDIARITERFYRAMNVRSTNFSGMGIGLYVVKEILTAHGGTLRIESRHGAGTQIQVRLPRGLTADHPE
jgi:PAS domain S-box-containing protein